VEREIREEKINPLRRPFTHTHKKGEKRRGGLANN